MIKYFLLLICSTHIYASSLSPAITAYLLSDDSVDMKALNVTIKGKVEVANVITLDYDFINYKGLGEGDSVIVFATEREELQRSKNHTFLIPEGYDGEQIFAWVYPADINGNISEEKYDADNSGMELIYGDIFYLDSRNGNDLNDGKSALTPLKTINRVSKLIQNGFIQDGSNILFKRGEIFDDKYFSIALSGDKTKYNPLVIGAYGDKNLAKPIFTGGSYIYGNQAFAEHIIVQDIAIINQNVGTSLSFNRQDVKDLRISRVDFDGAKNNAITLNSVDGYLIEDCNVTNMGLSGIVIYGNKDIEFDAGWLPITNGIIRRNRISNLSPTNGDGITLHRADASDFLDEKNNIGANHLIEDNIIHGCGENAIDITAGEAIIARHNELYDARQGLISIGHGAKNVSIDSNYLHDGSYSAVTIGHPASDIGLFNNIIEVTNRRAFEIGSNDNGNIDNIRMYNNTIRHLSQNEVVRISGVTVKNISFINNIVDFSNDKLAPILFCSETNPTTVGINFSNNLLARNLDSADNYAIIYQGGNKTSINFTSWQTSYMQGQDSLLHVSNLVNNSFLLQANSWAIGNALDIGLSYDYAKNIRSNPSDIGAIEYLE